MQDNNRPEALLPDPELDLDLELDFDHIMAEFSAEAPAQEEPEPAAEENQPVETAEEVSPEPADIKAEESTLIRNLFRSIQQTSSLYAAVHLTVLTK